LAERVLPAQQERGQVTRQLDTVLVVVAPATVAAAQVKLA